MFFSSQISNRANTQLTQGLKKTVNGSMSIPFDVVNINPSTGNTTFEGYSFTNSLVAVAAGATAYDQQKSKCIF